MRLNMTKAVFAAIMLIGALQANASVLTDAKNDYVAGYAGSKIGDLDVLEALLTYNPANDTFHFESKFAANIGLTPTGFYVLGINRGAGTAGFASLQQVLFDSVVRFNLDGSGVVNRLGGGGSTAFGVGTAKIHDDTLIADIAGSLLPSTGFAKTNYTWNLWPRDGALAGGFGQISDFAPDASNASVQVVPLPGAFWLFGSVFAMVKLAGSNRQPRNMTIKSVALV